MARPELEFTKEDRKLVETLAGYGLPHDDIALLIKDGITRKTLAKHFRRELDAGKAKANAKIAQSLFKQATEGNITAAIFWAKTQMGWREVNYVDVTRRDATELTEDELYSIAATGSTRDTETESGKRKLN